MNSSEYMNSPNNMNSSDYTNSYVPPCVFVPDKELDVLTNGHDKSNTLDDTSEMYRYRLYRHRSCNTNLYYSNSYDINLDRVTDSHVE
jgi:hypothetical protein